MVTQQIKQGYEQTELDMIPEGWIMKPLSELCKKDGLVRGPFGSNLKKSFFVNSGIKVYEQKNAIKRDISLGTYFITKKKFFELKRFEVKEGDFILSCSGTIGRIFLLPENSPVGIINQALLLIKINEDIINKKYFFHYFDWDKLQEKIIDNTHGGAMQNLVGMSIFRQIPIALPEEPREQLAIVNALDDISELIKKLEQQIIKKKNIQLGTMQEFLSGRKRLEGFSGKWIMKKLGDVLKVKHGKSQKKVEDKNGKYPILATGGKIGMSSKFLYDKPSVLIGRKGTIDKPQYMETPFWTVDTLFYTEILKDMIPKFLFYKFKKISWYNYNEASGVPSLNTSTIEKIEEMFPPTKEEQIAITDILSNMDSEIKELKIQKDKYVMIKHGMMQKLMTGEIRLK